MNQATLCLLIKEDKILLAMKKRGFGAGKWNGVGGKVNDGEKIIDAAIRETKEEIGVNIGKSLPAGRQAEKVGIMHFRFPYKSVWDQDVHLFLVKEWQGEPKESDEMAPKWFKFNEIPYNQMWDDDKFWLPHILKGEKIEADFVFKKGHVKELVSSFRIQKMR